MVDRPSSASIDTTTGSRRELADIVTDHRAPDIVQRSWVKPSPEVLHAEPIRPNRVAATAQHHQMLREGLDVVHRTAPLRSTGLTPPLGRLLRQELGYLPLPNEAASALFQVVSQRYLKSSIVLTTNRPVGSWGEILGDTTVAAALLDRLLHRCVVLTLDGESYRLRDHHAAADSLRRATTGNNR
jgi:hypothetical protein